MIKRNENRVGYKKTMVGWIPKEWGTPCLGEVANVLFSNVDKKTKHAEINVFLCNYNVPVEREIGHIAELLPAVIMEDGATLAHGKDIRRRARPNITKVLCGIAVQRAPGAAVIVQDGA